MLRGTSPATDGKPLERSNSGKALNNLELVENLCAASPTLREARRVHVKNFGALIPHVFMGDVLARIGNCVSLGAAHAMRNHREELESLLAALEQGMTSGDRETRNVISISFVRDSEHELFFEELRPLLGPRLRAQRARR